MSARRPAFLLDRDGTINEDPGFLADPEDLVLLPGAARAIARANAAGFAVVVVTNQSGIARGIFDEAALARVHAALAAALEREGARLDAVFHCPHHPAITGWCRCRKPAPGLLLDAITGLSLDPRRSLAVGDKPGDLAAGRAAGVRTAHVRAGRRAPPGDPFEGVPPHVPRADRVVTDLADAIDWFLES